MSVKQKPNIRKEIPMTMITPDFAGGSTQVVTDSITDLLRSHARHLLARALEVEVTEMMDNLKSTGRDVVRNGYLPERSITTAIGDVSVEVPRIRSRDGGSLNFHSRLIPPYLKRSKSIDAWAAYAYLRGISESDISAVLETILGEGARKLSPNVISSLKAEWRKQFDEWKRRDLSGITFTYIWADGIYQEIRGDNPKLCILTIIGVDDQGKKHLIALEDGLRESKQSWREVLVDLRSRGMNAPLVAVGDGALGFWAALDEIFVTTKQQRCWVHKTGINRPSMVESNDSSIGTSMAEFVEVAFDAPCYPVMAGGFVGPSPGVGVVLKGADIIELLAE